MALDLSCNTLPLECVLLKMVCVGEPRCVENANLWKLVSLHTMFEIPNNHHYAVLAPELVKSRRLGLALVVRTTGLLVGVVEGVEVVVIDVVAVKDIVNELQERGLSYPSLSNKKDGVWRFHLVL